MYVCGWVGVYESVCTCVTMFVGIQGSVIILHLYARYNCIQGYVCMIKIMAIMHIIKN